MKPAIQRRVALALVAALALSACDGHGGEGADCPPGAKQKTPSGFCVPRYLSLKRGEVFGRLGPGRDYATVFVYRAQGLPVQVVDETADWRRICDPDGGAAWVSRVMLAGQRTVMNKGAAPVVMRRGPSDTSGVAAYLRPRSVAELGRCRNGWCEISAGGTGGWVKSSEVWGLAP
ncbi:MAG: SH3 domain-containing protein, partial [Caulobacteraceae bacterium]